MKRVSLFASLSVACALFTSCGSSSVPATDLTAGEQSLLNALNAKRAQAGKPAVQASASLTDLARKDATRRVSEGAGYIDNRKSTGYDKLVTLSGRARSGETFGYTLMNIWSKVPQQSEWITGSYANAGVGTAKGANGLETGVLLLGGFSADSDMLNSPVGSSSMGF